MDFINLRAQYAAYKKDIDASIAATLSSASFIGGANIAAIEDAIGERVGMHTIATSNGTDALYLALLGLNLGRDDEVITSDFSFFASCESILHAGARVVFCDIDKKTFNMDMDKLPSLITPRTKAIMPISLYGQMYDVGRLEAVIDDRDIVVIEDGAQSFGAVYKSPITSLLTPSCGASALAATSFFPSKPLGCYGDGGMIFLKDGELATYVRALANHGSKRRYHHEYIGVNARLDSLQAGILLAKLPHLDNEIELRASAASYYDEALCDIVDTPFIAPYTHKHVYAQYTIVLRDKEEREKLASALAALDIPTAIHYPSPLHRQPALDNLGLDDSSFANALDISSRVLSLPFSPFITREEQMQVVDGIKRALDA